MSSLLLLRLLKLSFIMFSLNLVDYPMFSLLLSTFGLWALDWDLASGLSILIIYLNIFNIHAI